VEVPRRAAEEEPAEAAQHGISQVAILPWHRAGLDPTREAVAHHQVGSGAEPLEERHHAREVVAPIRVAHHHVPAARGEAAEVERRAVAADRHVHDASALRLGELLRAVARAVVRHEHLAGHTMALEKLARLAHARADGLRLVEAGHQDRELEGLRPCVRRSGRSTHCNRPDRLHGVRFPPGAKSTGVRAGTI
jgi:hypothetical protein